MTPDEEVVAIENLDEIADLQNQLTTARTALEPFAVYAQVLDKEIPDTAPIVYNPEARSCTATVGDCRKALAAIDAGEEPK